MQLPAVAVVALVVVVFEGDTALSECLPPFAAGRFNCGWLAMHLHMENPLKKQTEH